jgi:hypothetical protein
VSVGTVSILTVDPCRIALRGEQRRCGGTTANDTLSPAASGIEHILTIVSFAQFVCAVRMPGSPLFNAMSRSRAWNMGLSTHLACAAATGAYESVPSWQNSTSSSVR